MYLLQSESSFDAAHFLKNYTGKCKNIHGHRWRIVVRLSGDHLIPDGPKAGMLLDFGDLKAALNSLTDEFDHALLIEEGTLKESTVKALQDEDFRLVFLPFRTTAENFSRYFYERLVKMGFTPAEVQVYETPNNCAIYTGEDSPKQNRAFASSDAHEADNTGKDGADLGTYARSEQQRRDAASVTDQELAEFEASCRALFPDESIAGLLDDLGLPRYDDGAEEGGAWFAQL